MSQLNIIYVDTRHGFKTLELHEGDIADLDFQADVLVLSAFAGSYIPSTGTVIYSLFHTYRVDVKTEAKTPALDLRTALGLWVSRQLDSDIPVGRISASSSVVQDLG